MPTMDRIVIPFSGTIVHHDRKNQDHGGDDKTKRFHHKAVGNKEQAIENGAQFLLKGSGMKGFLRDGQFLFFLHKDAFQQKADGKNKHAADGDFRKRLCGNSGFLHRLDLRRDRKP